jgi:hypothetical protein
MKRLLLGLIALPVLNLALVPLLAVTGQEKREGKEGWIQLFDGKTLRGWCLPASQVGDWKVVDGVIVGRTKSVSHLFTERGDFDNFIFRIEAKISDKGNSGQYFRTKLMDDYPRGYEAQINSTHPDPQRTGSLYGMARVTKMLVSPETWFTQTVIARGNHIIIKVNDEKVVDFVDKNNTYTRGHFAIQGHPPGPGMTESVVWVRKAEVKILPSSAEEK